LQLPHAGSEEEMRGLFHSTEAHPLPVSPGFSPFLAMKGGRYQRLSR